MIVQKAYKEDRLAYRAYRGDKIIWDCSTYTSGVAEAAMLGFAMAQTETPLDIQMCASANAILSALARTRTVFKGELKATDTMEAVVNPEPVTPADAELHASAVMQGFAMGYTYGLVFTSGVASGKMQGIAYAHPADAVPAMGTATGKLTGTASADPVEMLDLLLPSSGAGIGTTSAKPQAPLRVQMAATGAMAGSGYAINLPIHTVSFKVNGKIKHQEKVIHGYACPDPVETGKMDKPTKEMTVSHTFDHSGWEAETTETTLVPLLETEDFPGFVQHPDFGMYFMGFPKSFSLVVGESYTVSWDGQEYDVIAQDASALNGGAEMNAIGNGAAFGMSGNNEPFIIATNADALMFFVVDPSDSSSTHTVGIYQQEVDVVVDGDPLSCITQDIVVNATFTESIRYYTVRFFDNGEQVDTDSVPYGGTAVTDYMKEGFNQVEWVPSNENITQDTDCHGQFSNIKFDEATWAQIVQIANSGKAASSFAIGDKKEAVLTYADGITEAVNFVLAGFDECYNYDTKKPSNMVLVIENALSETRKAHSNFSVGYWYNTELDSFINNDVYSALPEDLKNGVKRKWCDFFSLYEGGDPMSGWPRYCWLLDLMELNIQALYYNKYLTPLPIFTNDASRIKCLGTTGVPTQYWSMSDQYSSNYTNMAYIKTDGTSSNTAPNSGALGIVFGIIL